MDSFTDEPLPIPERLVRDNEARGRDPFFIREREYGMDRYARFGPTDKDKRATTVATDSSSLLFCFFDELGYC